MSKGKGLFGWIIGLLTGTILGVLFAPRKGSDFRKRVQSSREKGQVGHEPMLEDLKKMGEDIADTARGIYESQEVQEVIARGRDHIDELNVEPFFDKAKEVHKVVKKKAKSVKKSLRG